MSLLMVRVASICPASQFSFISSSVNHRTISVQELLKSYLSFHIDTFSFSTKKSLSEGYYLNVPSNFQRYHVYLKFASQWQPRVAIDIKSDIQNRKSISKVEIPKAKSVVRPKRMDIIKFFKSQTFLYIKLHRAQYLAKKTIDPEKPFF